MMKNIEYLRENINQVKAFIADTEQRITDGEWWLDAQLGSLKFHLNDLRTQLVKAIKSKEGNGGSQRSFRALLARTRMFVK